MQYLVDRYDKNHSISYPAGSPEAVEVTNWLFFQNTGIGPMGGQLGHFLNYAPEKIPYAIERYRNEFLRLMKTLDDHLAPKGPGYLVGDRCTIADIAIWSWVAETGFLGIEAEEFQSVLAWKELMYSRPAVKRGADVPVKFAVKAAIEKHL